MNNDNNNLSKLKKSKILVTGASGFLGSKVIEMLLSLGVPKENLFTPRANDLDLRRFENCVQAVKGADIIIHLAAKVGGIGFNQKYPGELFYDNLMMGVQLMEAARKEGVKKFVGIATICAYPKNTPVPFKEDDLWSGYPEETNAPYGLAKKMLLVQAQAYRHQYGFNAITLFPVNLYGPGDNFDPENSHVIPALIRKFDEAIINNKNEVEVWGTGKATREFLFVDDAARGIIMATEIYNKPEPVNIGSGTEISIKDLVNTISNTIGYKGKISWNTSKPDGQPRRMLDTERALREFGFKSIIGFNEGLKKTIDWYQKNRP